MTLRHTHIISSVGWDTTFTQKGRSGDLQDRLSRWSRWRMPDELQSILDTLCPADQFWHIDQLQLDLGVIDYTDLENELSASIREVLQDTLRTMLYRQLSGDDTKFKIVNAASTDLQTLSFFLQNGYMPWYHSTQQLTYNKLFSQLLEQQTQATVQVIREIGKGNPDVRKRIAWQTDEPVLHQLVKGLEPVHHIEIISFTGEMTALQNKENLVTASQHGFKKNLWNWILNYLLQEKDTVFNKLAFVKSSLKQLAAHYNLEYEKLLFTTSRALEAVRKKMQLRTDLGRILALLTQQIGTAEPETPKQKETFNYWERFRTLLYNDARRESPNNQEEFNELFMALAGADKERFMALINPLGFSSKKWQNIAASLSFDSMETLFSLVNPRKGRQWISIVKWMGKATGSVVAASGHSILRLAAIKFLLRYQHSSQDHETFARYCAGQLVKHAGLRSEEVQKLFYNGEVTSSCASLQQVEIANLLRQHFLKLAYSKKENKLTEQIGQLLQAITRETAGHTQMQQQKLEQELRQLFFAKPALFLDTVGTHPQSVNVLKYILAITGQQELNVHLTESSYMHARLIRAVTATLMTTFEANADLKEWISRNLPVEAFKLIVEMPGINSPALQRKLLRVILLRQNVLSLASMQELLVTSFSSRSVSTNMKVMVRSVLDQEWSAINPDERIRSWKRYAGKHNTDRRLLARHIKLCRQQSVFRKLANMPMPDSKVILERLVPGSAVLAVQLFKQYDQLLKESGFASAGSQQRIKDIIWNAVIEAAISDNDIVYFRSQLDRAMRLVFPGIEDVQQQTEILTKPANRVNLGIKVSTVRLTPEYVLQLSREILGAGNKCVTINKKQVSYNDLLQFVLTEETAVLIAAIKMDKDHPALLKPLKARVKLDEFIWWMAGALPAGESTLLNEWQLLIDITTRLFPEAATYIEKRGWAITIEIIRGNIRTASTLQRIAQQVLGPLLIKNVPAADKLVSTLQSVQLTDTSPVRLAIQHLIPAVSAKLTVIKPKEHLPLFQQLTAKGLLSELIDALILHGELPHWFLQDRDMSTQEWTSLLITQQPAPVLQALRRAVLNEKTIANFMAVIGFGDYIRALQQVWPQQAAYLQIISRLFEVFRVITIKGIAASALQAMLYRLMIRLFKTDSRGSIDPTSCWKQLMIDLCAAYSVRPAMLLAAMQQHGQLLPPAILAANTLLQADLSAAKEHRITDDIPQLPKRKHIAKHTIRNSNAGMEKIEVKNAGLVIINIYLPMLFSRLGLVTDNQFNSPEHQQDAVHYLQYLSAAQDNAPEEYLVLNKILCGLTPDSPVKDRIDLTAEAKETIDGLITAAVNYWPAIGDTSVDGFRGNWLVRDGLICEKEENWFLSVEKRAYDVLLAKSPFSFSFIKYPWMEKPLKTEWPF